MKKGALKTLMVVLAIVPVVVTVLLARHLYQRKGVPEAVQNLTKQLFASKEEEERIEKQLEEVVEQKKELQEAYDALVANLKGEVDSRDISIRQYAEKLEINFLDKLLFPSASAEITIPGRIVLKKVAGALSNIGDKNIYVIGHTDNMPIASFLYPSNWELSTARASSVVRFLTDGEGLDPTRFTALGRAFYQPVAANDTPEGRQENRRVEIIVADAPLIGAQGGAKGLRSTVAPSPGPASSPAPGKSPVPAAPPAERPLAH